VFRYCCKPNLVYLLRPFLSLSLYSDALLSPLVSHCLIHPPHQHSSHFLVVQQHLLLLSSLCGTTTATLCAIMSQSQRFVALHPVKSFQKIWDDRGTGYRHRHRTDVHLHRHSTSPNAQRLVPHSLDTSHIVSRSGSRWEWPDRIVWATASSASTEQLPST
jgi:hypothetical protein